MTGFHGPYLSGTALGFSAGVFLCISLSDILLKVQFHSHARLKLAAAHLAGVRLAWGIGLLEPDTADSAVPLVIETEVEHPHPHSHETSD